MKKHLGLRKVLDKDAFLFVKYPYCLTFCKFCVYKVHKYNKIHSDYFLKYYGKEVDLYARELSDFKFKNIHIGGGTPNLIAPHLLIEPLARLADLGKVKRFVVEVFPRDDLKKYLRDLRKYPVTKIQLGIQTINEKILKSINRNVSRKTILDCLEVLSKSPYLWSVDLMYGFSEEDAFAPDYVSELKTVLDYKPHGVHLYPLRSERTNLFYGKKDKPGVKNLTYKKEIGYLGPILEILSERGYRQILDEWCLGANQRHAQKTICYNNETGFYSTVVGIGLDGRTYTRTMQYRNTRNLSRYASSLEKGIFPIEKYSDFLKNNLYPVYMLRMHQRMGAKFDIGRFLRSSGLSKPEKNEMLAFLCYLKNKGVRYEIKDGQLRMATSQYSLYQFLAGKYISAKEG